MARTVARTVTDREIGLVKAMIDRGFQANKIQFYFNRRNRPFNTGRVSNIRNGQYGPEVPCASDDELDEFIERNRNAGQHADEETDQELKGIEALKNRLVERSDGLWFVTDAEGSDIEFKEQILPKKLTGIIRAIAGFANHRGGGIIAGVRDDDRMIVGLDATSVKALDISDLTNKVKTHLSPTPVFILEKMHVGQAVVILIHVEAHESKPVMVVRDGENLEEGQILFRYPGQSAKIKHSDLYEMLRERDLRAQERMAAIMRDVVSIGAENAMVVDIKKGMLRDGGRHITIDKALSDKLKFIKEGEFNEREGAETLRLIGDIHRIDRDGNIVERVVSQTLQPHSILLSFLRRETVDTPIEYFRYSIATQKKWLPVFYFVLQAEMNLDDAVKDITARKSDNKATKDIVLERLKGRKSAFSVAGGVAAPIYDQIVSKDFRHVPGQSKTDIAATLRAVKGLKDDFQIPDELYGLLLSIAETAADGSSLWTDIYKAAARLDEIEFFQKNGA